MSYGDPGVGATAMPERADGLTTPWVWPARPPLDRGAVICAYLVFAAGLALITVRGVRESARDTTS